MTPESRAAKEAAGPMDAEQMEVMALRLIQGILEGRGGVEVRPIDAETGWRGGFTIKLLP